MGNGEQGMRVGMGMGIHNGGVSQILTSKKCYLSSSKLRSCRLCICQGRQAGRQCRMLW